MSADFSTTGTRNLAASAPVTAVPLTISCWFNTPADNTQKTLVSVGVSGATHRCLLQTTTTNLLQAATVGSSIQVATVTTAFTGNVWNHACGFFSSFSARRVVLNGTFSPQNSVFMPQSTFNDLRIGARWSTTLGLYMRGLIAEVGIWNITLNTDEIISLSTGINCSKIRPESLVFYSPLIREFVNIVEGSVITNNGVTASDHPRIYY